MSNPKKAASFVYPIMEEIFVKYLSNKHDKPFADIKIADMSDDDIKRWQKIESYNNVKLAVGDINKRQRNVVH